MSARSMKWKIGYRDGKQELLRLVYIVNAHPGFGSSVLLHLSSSPSESCFLVFEFSVISSLVPSQPWQYCFSLCQYSSSTTIM